MTVSGIAIPAAILLVAIAMQWPILDRAVVPMDEGQLVAIADRMLHGERLYSDIHTGLFPGIYHFTARLLALVGDDLVVTRWAQASINALIALCLWAFGRRASGKFWAVIPPLLYLGLIPWAHPALSVLNYSPLSMLFALGAAVALLRYLDSGRASSAIAIGALLFASAMVKQNFGVLAALAVLLGLLANRAHSALAARTMVESLAPIVASGATLTLLCVGVLAWSGNLHEMVETTLLQIVGGQMEGFVNPIPPVLGAHPTNDPRFVFLYSPPALFNYLLRGEALLGSSMPAWLPGAAIRLSYGSAFALLLGGGVLLGFAHKQADERQRGAVICAVVFAASMFLGLFPSAIWAHLAYVAAPLLLLLAPLGDRLESVATARAPGLIMRGVAAGLVIAVLAAGSSVGRDIRRWNPSAMELPRASLFVSAEHAKRLQDAVAFLQDCAPPDTPVFVAPDIPLVYFLSDRRNPSPFDLTIPGRVDGPLIVERLEATATRCVIYNPAMYPEFPAFAKLFPELDRYLTEDFQRVAVLGDRARPWYGLVRRAGSASGER